MQSRVCGIRTEDIAHQLIYQTKHVVAHPSTRKLAIEALQVAMVRMVARIVEGDVGKAICKESNRLKPAALVMDGYQRQRFIPKGSVSEYCFHNCKSAPVIIVPEKEAKEESVI